MEPDDKTTIKNIYAALAIILFGLGLILISR
jgi:hypothetical protein